MPPVVPTPNREVNYVHATAGEVLSLGPLKLRIKEDGSRTGNMILLHVQYLYYIFPFPRFTANASSPASVQPIAYHFSNASRVSMQAHQPALQTIVSPSLS